MTHVSEIRIGDTVTFDGDWVRNPARWWFQFWKPRWVRDASKRSTFVVTA